MYQDSFCKVVVVLCNFEIVDSTVWTHSEGFSSTCELENLNTVYPSDFNIFSFFSSWRLRVSEQWLLPSISIPICRSEQPMSSL